jgi:hypothetical protein
MQIRSFRTVTRVLPVRELNSDLLHSRTIYGNEAATIARSSENIEP